MLSSITPLGERGRGRRWGLTTAAYVTGSAAAAATAGALAGLAGSLLLDTASLAIVAVLLGVGVALDALGAVPGPRRQVDESWLYRYRGGVYGFGYGAQLGLGVVTLVTGSAVYVVLGAAFATASPAAGAAVGFAAGVLRGATLLSTWPIRDTARLVRFHERMDAGRHRARTTALIAQLALAIVAVGALVA